MTFVLNQKADMLLNVERCSYLYVGEDNCVKAIMDGAKMVRVGTYTDYDCACAALEDVAARIKSGDKLCRFAASEAMLTKVVNSRDPARDKFAANGKKTVRRGGS